MNDQNEDGVAGLSDLCTGPAAMLASPLYMFPAVDLPSFVQALSWSKGAAGRHANVNLVPGEVRAQGCGLGREAARIRCVAEALERYCTAIALEEELLIGSAAELGDACLNLDEVAVISKAEEEHPKCSLKRASPNEKIRWVRGVSLTSKSRKLIPAIMVFSHLPEIMPGERFWLPISTGCAAHSDLEMALRAGIFEVVERDTIALTWLQMLALPKIEIDEVSGELMEAWSLYQRASSNVEFSFFDATTDLGIPVVYGIRRARYSTTSHTLVACSAAATLQEAVTKVLYDLVSIGTAFERQHSIPDSFDDFCNVFHGAAYMAHSERAHAFEFLLTSKRKVLLSRSSHAPQMNCLDDILDIFRQRNMSVYAVDLTTDEAKSVGMKVVRVLIPALQPLSFAYRAQYKGNERLYNAPAAMGYRANQESQLNQWPQPFA